MAFYALDEESRIVSALNAEEMRRYRCLECKSPVKKRSFRDRRPHFCHLRTERQCRLYSKSIDHLVFQTHLKSEIPTLIIEKPFPSILRIADLCWEEKKMVLEIQCSPISPHEVQMRSRDYLQEGYTLIWLLDDRLYNKRRVKISESLLRDQSGYYFSLHKFRVYDQFEVLDERNRLARGPPLSIDLSRPKKLLSTSPQIPLRQLSRRRIQHYFWGDLLDRALSNQTYLINLIEYEKTILSKIQQKRRLSFLAKKMFYIGMEWLLRRSSKESSENG